MRRFWLVSLALALVLSLAACGGGSESTESGSPTDDGSTAAPDDSAGSTSSGGSSGGSSDGIATVEDIKAFFAEWYADVTDVTLETMLGAPVLAIHVA